MRPVLMALILAFICSIAPAMAAVPATITYQGYLTGARNAPLNSPVAMTLSIYSEAVGSVALWSEHQPEVPVVNGLYTVQLGSVTPLNLPFDTPYFLGVAIGSDPEMTPRHQLTTVPYAFRAKNADSIAMVCADGEVLKFNAALSGWGCALAAGPQGVPGPAGPPGVSGVTGPAGTAGLNGRTVLNGAGHPVTTGAGGTPGDFYLDTANNMMYGPKTGSGWGDVSGISLVGPQGPAGVAGAVGPVGPAGATGPVGAQGPVGLTGAVGPTGPAGVAGVAGPAGTAGLDGKTVLNGAGDPVTTSAGGTPGDFYLDTANNMMYGPKTGSGWGDVSGISLVGPQGPAGVAGAVGPVGPAGATGAGGAQGPMGLTGAVGPAGPAGPAGAAGVAGPAGTAGLDGKTVLNGAGDPVTTGAGGTSGDFYLDTANNMMYGPKTGSGWGDVAGISLVGPQGPAGVAGATGATGATGAQGPIGLTGPVGPRGDEGKDGKTILSGSGSPVATGAMGVLGDFYFDTANTVIYGPKTGADWSGITGVSLIGDSGLTGYTDGSGNTALGSGSGSSTTPGNGNTFIGSLADAVTGGLANATAIGGGAIVDDSNHIRIGNAAVTQIGGQVAWSNLSDIRTKKDIHDITVGLDFIAALRPVEFRMKQGNERTDFGFIAQDIEALLGSGYNILGIGGDPERTLSVRYTDFIAPMVRAIQEQQAIITKQNSVIENLAVRLADLEKLLNLVR